MRLTFNNCNTNHNNKFKCYRNFSSICIYLFFRHLPPWLLPGYGADGAHCMAPDTQMHVRHWKT